MPRLKLTSDGAVVPCDCGRIHNLEIQYHETGEVAGITDEVTFLKKNEEETVDGKAKSKKDEGSDPESDPKKRRKGFGGFIRK